MLFPLNSLFTDINHLIRSIDPIALETTPHFFVVSSGVQLGKGCLKSGEYVVGV